MFRLLRNCKSGWLITFLILAGCSRSDDQATTQPSATGAASPPVATSTDQPPPGEKPKLVARAVAAQPGVPVQTSPQDAVARGLAHPITAGTPAGRLVIGDAKSDQEGEKGVPLLKPGATAPDFVSVDLEGKEIHLSDWRDRIVVLDFWVTWCGPCRAAFPHVQEVAARCKDRDVVVLAICTSDTRDNFEEFVKANQDKYPDIVFTCDPDEKGAESFDDRASKKLFGVSGLPTQFVIDRNGRIAAVLEGYEKDEHRLEDALGDLGIKIEPSPPVDGSR